jgi:hypothetical protein
MRQPAEVATALLADQLAQRYGCLPTDILKGDAENLLIWTIVTQMAAKRGN